MKNWGFASQLKNVYLGSTIAKFLPGPLAKNFCWLVQPLNENLGFRLPAGKSLLRFHYRQIFTRTLGQKIFAGWHQSVTGPTRMRRGPQKFGQVFIRVGKFPWLIIGPIILGEVIAVIGNMAMTGMTWDLGRVVLNGLWAR